MQRGCSGLRDKQRHRRAPWFDTDACGNVTGRVSYPGWGCGQAGLLLMPGPFTCVHSLVGQGLGFFQLWLLDFSVKKKSVHGEREKMPATFIMSHHRKETRLII